MKATKQQIDKFLMSNTFAMAGVSRNSKKFGHQAFLQLRKKGYNILPVNPHADQIDGEKCFKSICELPSNIESLLIMTSKADTDVILQQALDKGIANIWIQQFSETEQTFSIVKNQRANIILKQCIYMFVEPVTGLHGFHKFLSKAFNKYPV